MAKKKKVEEEIEVTEREDIIGNIGIEGQKYTVSEEQIKIAEISNIEAIKRGREDTLSGLSKLIKEMGVLEPIQVIEVNDDENAVIKYILIDGLRRLYGAAKSGLEEIPAKVWRFEDRESGMKAVLSLHMVLNRREKHTWKEQWTRLQALDVVGTYTSDEIEYLLQMDYGEAMQLKDVMTSEFPEPRETLLSGKKNLAACYKLLQKQRKENERLKAEDEKGFSDVGEDAKGIVGENVGKRELDDGEVRELLDMADTVKNEPVGEVEEEDFDSLNKVDEDFVETQQVGDRHPLDKALREAVLSRDERTCACCGYKMVGINSGSIAVHHIIPVHCKGKDTLDNLITLCVRCHIALHICERNGGSFMMEKEDFEKLPQADQEAMTKALKYAKVAIEADKRRGLSKEQVAQKTQEALKHPMPKAEV
ncbi:MAG: HNH endonuclease [Oscillospiraceae bacterium]|jgi:5-methylcytosine-specific restriction endonuclease McrA/ParB-like chromosome segregation protein Spo0J|nr:HNH endonuclease [Oscillospiraceae bacterium]